jgi:hypothetical protein
MSRVALIISNISRSGLRYCPENQKGCFTAPFLTELNFK